MSAVVLDASVALAWCFPDETSENADRILVALEGHAIFVPAVWPLEIANALLVGERRKRLKQADTKSFMELLEGLSIVQDSRTVGESIGQLLPLAREHGLTAYDAAYLELALRRSVALATLDRRLHKAAARAGIPDFPDLLDD